MAEQNGTAGSIPSNPRPSSTSYPSPHSHSYPSPSMQPYQYPPPQPSSNEPYRQSPTGPNATLPSINLPPIRGVDGHSPTQGPPGPNQPGVPSMHPPQGMYYPPPGQHPMLPPSQLGGAPPPHMMRYPIPTQGPDARMLAGRGQKKDIKRRTKTGCLTCRKRRIKVSTGVASLLLFARGARTLWCGWIGFYVEAGCEPGLLWSSR